MQSKLVIKSIEALHDEALALTLDNTTQSGVTELPAPTILRAARPNHESPANAPTATANEHDIMARIDDLIKKVDEEDDPAITPPSTSEPLTNTQDMADPASGTAAHHTPNAGSATLSDDTDIARPNNSQDSNSGDTADDAKTDNIEGENIAADDYFETDRGSKDQVLADIATAVFQAQQKEAEPVTADAERNTATPVDIDILTATVSEEVRHTVSKLMAAELPQMVRDAVSEAIHTISTNTIHHKKLAAVKKSPAKTSAKRKKNAIKTTATKKSARKKTVAKKITTAKNTPKKTTKSP